MGYQILGGRADPNRKGVVHRWLIASGHLEEQAVHFLTLSGNDLSSRLRLRLAGGRTARDTLRYFKFSKNSKHTVFDCCMPRDRRAQDELKQALLSQLNKQVRELAKQKKKGKVVIIVTR